MTMKTTYESLFTIATTVTLVKIIVTIVTQVKYCGNHGKLLVGTKTYRPSMDSMHTIVYRIYTGYEKH